MTEEQLILKIDELKALTKAENYPFVEKLGRELLSMPALINHPDFHFAVLIEWSVALSKQRKFNEALIPTLQSLDLLDSTKVEQADAKVYHILGSLYSSLSDYELASQYLNKSLDAYKSYGNKKTLNLLYHEIGNIHFFTSSFPLALEAYQNSLALSEEFDDQAAIARTTGNLGIIFMDLNEYGNALKYFERSLNMSAEIGDKNINTNATGNISLIYLYLGDYPKALEYGFSALQKLEDLKDVIGAATIQGNIGDIYFEANNYESCLEYYTKAYAAFKSMGHQVYASRQLSNIGHVHIKLGRFREALDCLNTVRLEANDLKASIDQSFTLSRLGILFSIKDFDGFDVQQSEHYFLEALEIIKTIGAKRQEYFIYKHLADIYEQQDKINDALLFYKKYHQLFAEVQSDQASKHAQQLDHRRKIEESERDRQVKLARFQEQEKILHNILPVQIADRILEGEKQIADYCENVSIFFSDIVGFTKLSQHQSPQELVNMLNEVFSEFDRIARKHGLEKIKTIGDAYMAVAGLPVPQDNHAERAALFALEVMQWMEDYRKRTGNALHIRAGLHCGHAVAGVIGENKFAYDLWGDAVNTASRMESHGTAGKIQVSEDFMKALYHTPFMFEARGEMEVKGKGLMKTFFINHSESNSSLQ